MDKIRMVEEIKPCPFCGGEASVGKSTYAKDSEITVLNGQNVFYSVNCHSCNGRRNLIGEKSHKEAIEKWNQRVEVKPATPVPTQPSEVGPKMSLPDSTEVDYPLKPPFKVVQFGDEFLVCDEEKTIVEGIVFRNELNADWIAEALNAYAFGQSTARSQERRVRKWKAGEGPYHLGAWYNAEEGTEEETIEGPGFPKGIDSFELTNEILNIAYAQGLAAKEAEFEKINVRLMKAEADLAKATDRWEKLQEFLRNDVNKCKHANEFYKKNAERQKETVVREDDYMGPGCADELTDEWKASQEGEIK